MNLVRFAIDRPIAVIAAVLMVVLFGLVALETIPIQLTPDVRKPIITVQTLWPGAAPAEVEREIVNRQEEMLKGVEGLEEVESRSENGRARVTLTFAIGTNMDRALLLVANRLDRVSGYPDEADRPTLRTASAEDNAIAWFAIQTVEGNSRPVHTYGDFVEEVIQDRVERVEGVSRTDAFGGVRRELHITVQPERMAQFGLTVTEITQKLRAANASVSAGDVEEGKRRYLVRAEGDLDTPEAVRAVVLRTAADSATGRIGRVTVGDIAEVSYGYSEPRARIRRLGKSAVVMNAKREAGANVIETMEGVRAAVAELNETVLPGEGLVMEQVYDETDYIVSAIDLVRQNIVVGGALAAIMLLLFLRSWRPTLIVSLAIPVSVVGSFVAMAMLGRSLNVVSLAGIAFAVGMVVDAAIVVLENIYRLRERGMPPREAALRGASQVWGAILVSALTTVLVFVPILAMDLEVGQLFRDIAVAISVSVMLSLIVAITVIPALSRRLLATRVWTGGRFEVPVLDGFARRYARATLAYAGAVVRNRKAALVSVAAIVGLAVAVAWWLTPKLDYLPDGSRNFVLGRVLPPPGYNLRTNSEIAREIEDSTRDALGERDRPRARARRAAQDRQFLLRGAAVLHLRRRVLHRPHKAGRTGAGAARGLAARARHLRLLHRGVDLRARHRRQAVDRPRHFRTRPRNRDGGGGTGDRHDGGGAAAQRGQPAPPDPRPRTRRAGSARDAGPAPACRQRRVGARTGRHHRRLQ